MKLSEIAKLLEGQLVGEDLEISSLSTLELGQKNQLGYVADNKFLTLLENSSIAAVIVNQKLENSAKSQIIVSNVKRAWRIIAENYQKTIRPPRKAEIHKSAVIAETAQLGEGVFVGANAVIEENAVIGTGAVIEPLAFVGRGVIIGENTRIGAGVKVLEGTKIGKNCNVLANAVIGERGFGNDFDNGAWQPIPQIGGVIIGDNVEIGASTMIDRGALGDTIIGNGVKLDNLIQVAHNVEIGDHTAMAGCSVIAGSVKIGKYCIIGGACVINGHITIADGVMITGHSSISKSITEPKSVYSGAWIARKTREWNKFMASLNLLIKEKK